MQKEIEEMQKAITCLAIQLPESVYEDVNRKWLALRTKLLPKTTLECPDCMADLHLNVNIVSSKHKI